MAIPVPNREHGSMPLSPVQEDPSKPPTLRERLVDSQDLLILLLLPLVLYAVNDSWTYVKPQGLIDNYIYLGYMGDLKNYISDFGPTYYGSRLPQLLPGALLHEAFPSGTASLVMRFLVFYVAAFSLYCITLALWRNRTASLVTVVLFCFHAYFLQAISWDYVDGTAIALTLLTLLLLTLAATRQNWQWWMTGAGFAAVSMVSVQFFLVTFTPLLALWFFVLNLRFGRRPVIDLVLWAVTGGALAFVFYCLVNSQLGGDLNYLWPQYHVASDGMSRSLRAPGLEWLDSAAWLVFVAFGVTAAVALLVKLPIRSREALSRLTDREYGDLAAALVGIAAFSLALIMEFSVGQRTMQLSYYANLIFPFCVLPLGAIIARSASSWTQRVRSLLLVAVVVLFLLPMSTSTVDDVLIRPPAGTVLVAMPALLLAGACLVASLYKPSVGLLVATLAIFSLLNIATSDGNRLLLSGRAEAREQAAMITDIDAVLKATGRGTRLTFWYNLGDPHGYIFRGVSSMHLFSYRLIGEDFPTLRNEMNWRDSPIGAGQAIVLMSSTPDALELAGPGLERNGLRAQTLIERTFRKGHDTVYVTVVLTEPATGP